MIEKKNLKIKERPWNFKLFMNFGCYELYSILDDDRLRKCAINSDAMEIRMVVTFPNQNPMVIEEIIPICFWESGLNDFRAGCNNKYIIAGGGLLVLRLDNIAYQVLDEKNNASFYNNFNLDCERICCSASCKNYYHVNCKFDFTLNFIRSNPTGIFYENKIYRQILNECFKKGLNVIIRTNVNTHVMKITPDIIEVTSDRIVIKDNFYTDITDMCICEIYNDKLVFKILEDRDVRESSGMINDDYNLERIIEVSDGIVTIYDYNYELEEDRELDLNNIILDEDLIFFLSDIEKSYENFISMIIFPIN